MSELILNCEHIDLNYFEGPNNGPTILLIHGNMGRWQSFTPILDELMQYMHVLALDLRGHGKSGRNLEPYYLLNYLSDIAAFMQAKTHSPSIIFGHSLGGMIGIMLAARHPALVKGLIIGDSPLTQATLLPIIESQKELGNRIYKYLVTTRPLSA